MSPHFKPCGYCSRCIGGKSVDCLFPAYNGSPHTTVVTTKSFDDVSRRVLDNAPLLTPLLKETKKKKTETHAYHSCAESHPALKIGDVLVWGGKAANPVKKNCDIYVSLDKYASASGINKYPWKGPVPIRFTFSVPDMGVPGDTDEFKKMIAWLKEQALAGKKIHVGCMGGHGRTGLVLVALVKEMTGEEDAIAYVRKNYCAKVIESKTQVDWLVKNFGVKTAKGSKEYDRVAGAQTFWPDYGTSIGTTGRRVEPGLERIQRMKEYSLRSNDVAHPIEPLACSYNVWGAREDADWDTVDA